MNKICFISNTSFNLYNFRREIINRFINEGFEVYTIANKDNFTNKLIDIGCNHISIDYNQHSFSFILNYKNFLKHFRQIKIIKPNLIFSFTIKPNIISLLISFITFQKYKSIVTISGFGTLFLKKGLKIFLIKKIYFFLLKFATHIFFHNENDKKIINKVKSSVIPGSGINLLDYKVSKINKFNNNTFLYIGRLIKEKGLQELYEQTKIIFNHNHNFKLIIVGDYDSYNPNKINKKLFSDIKQNKNIKYFNFTDNIQSFFDKADCTILPSYREGMPRSLLESSALGIPLIGSNVPGINELIIDGFNGFLFDLNDSSSITHAIEKFIKLSPHQKKQMGLNARKRVEANYSIDIVVKSYLKKANEFKN